MTKHDFPTSEIPSSSSDIGTVSDGGYYQQGEQYGAMGHAGSGKMLGVVHPSGKVAWVPYEHFTTLSSFKGDVASMLGMEGCDFNIARATPLLHETVVDYQCIQGEILYMLPKVAGYNAGGMSMPQYSAPTVQQQQQQQDPMNGSIKSNASMDGSMHSYGAPHGMGVTSPLGHSGCPPGWQVMSLEDKVHVAAMKLLGMVNNSKVCTELQSCLEAAHSMGIDCMPVFRSVEENLADLVVHPAGNYLVTKCFDWHVTLIEQSAELMSHNMRFYALHKHASYVIEAMLTHQLSSPMVRHTIISQVLSPNHRVAIATSDSGNFVIQKSIETCPDELLPLLMEAVQSVSQLTQHGTKMQKKLQARIQNKPAAHHRENSRHSRHNSTHSNHHHNGGYNSHNARAAMHQQHQMNQMALNAHPGHGHMSSTEHEHLEYNQGYGYVNQTAAQPQYQAQHPQMPPQQQQAALPQQQQRCAQPNSTRQYNPYAVAEDAPEAPQVATQGSVPTPANSSPRMLPSAESTVPESSAKSSCGSVEGETSANQSNLSWADMDA
eukprot:TRINITY_DN1528_c0_g7_i1.p1 TRINITY_DN1528_c0_g7~~TRINITY_DN1528_c0_g7_i1.p1  ORF type:complete len:548 (+),score=221.94 TRINITY_DN1528_c0_g7_i1:200-1843(+)